MAETALLINGAEPRDRSASGRLNDFLHATVRDELAGSYSIVVSDPRRGYAVHDEQQKFLAADLIVFQFPVYWFSVPSTLKKYIDDVYAFGTFFGPAAHYGRGGLLGGKNYLVSTTWNAASEDFGSSATILGEHTVDEVLVAFHLTQQYVGLAPLPSFTSHDVIHHPDAELAAEQLREHLRQHVTGVAPRRLHPGDPNEQEWAGQTG